MNPKKIILCPNPSRDRGMNTTKRVDKMLREMGFRTVVCSPFKDQKDGAFADMDVRPLHPELRSADMLITFGGDGTILHLAKLVALPSPLPFAFANATSPSRAGHGKRRLWRVGLPGRSSSQQGAAHEGFDSRRRSQRTDGRAFCRAGRTEYRHRS